ncbi:MAG: tetratricopeptide repeat protein [Gammaproteobacteria bacterium]|nr:tetratricopeptide repeat protein [Gammaproteobacteria bacterium]
MPRIFLNRSFSCSLFSLVLVPLSVLGSATVDEPAFVGRERCTACHEAESAAWSGSHHDLAMQAADDESVLGDFNDAKLTVFGVTSEFFRKDGQFRVRTDGPDGKLQDYPVRYTFGVYPLQQYLIEFPGGRLQALDIAWDARPAEQGGQRWFHLHPEDPVPPGDVLHWTGPNLNWNYMCADCHTTNLVKGYDAGTGRYETKWSEIDVSCEACHGPGSGHVVWAERAAKGEASGSTDKGLTVVFDERSGVAWSIDPDTGKPSRSKPAGERKEVDACARCHSRRGRLSGDDVQGRPFLDAYRPALLTEGLYHTDGQVEDEVYVWGSFLQSRMYQAGVTCSDCHDPHTAGTRLPGDAVCAQCHAPDRYAVASHHHHPQESAGANCLACHMPATTYMGVDARRDHSFRVPRPDLSVTLGVPDACTRCHEDEGPEWAAQQVEAWYGRPAKGLQDYAGTLDAARRRLPGADRLLKTLVADTGQPAIARATGLTHLGAYPDAESLKLIEQGLGSGDPLERLGALEALQDVGLRDRAAAFPLLEDDLLAVRIEAARVLAPFLRAARLPEAYQAMLEKGIEEYISVQAFNAERPETRLNLGALYAETGRVREAELAYRQALRLQPHFIPARVNLVQLLSENGREADAATVLEAGMALDPGDASLQHTMGLSLVRRKRQDEALEHLAAAARAAPEVSRYAYVYGVALVSGGDRDAGLKVLAEAQRRHPGDTDILLALVSYHRDAGHRKEALEYARLLRALTPGDPDLERLIGELEGGE